MKAGRNLYPQEIEEMVGALPGIRKGCVAAFGVADPAIGTERLVVIAESREIERRPRERLHDGRLDRVVAALGMPPDVVVIAEPGTVLKTSSGKIRRERDARGLCRRRPRAAAASPRAQWLRLLAGDRPRAAGRAGSARRRRSSRALRRRALLR